MRRRLAAKYEQCLALGCVAKPVGRQWRGRAAESKGQMSHTMCACCVSPASKRAPVEWGGLRKKSSTADIDIGRVRAGADAHGGVDAAVNDLETMRDMWRMCV